MFTDAEGESVQRVKTKFQEFNGGSEKVDGVQLSVQVRFFISLCLEYSRFKKKKKQKKHNL